MKINHTINMAPQIRLRWLTIACFELQIGDFSIVIDPCIGISPRAGFGAEVVEKANVILLSHGHWDHITDIKALMEKLSLAPDEVVAFGDQFNDVTMLDAVGHPYLMENASQQLKTRGYRLCSKVLPVLRSIVENRGELPL